MYLPALIGLLLIGGPARADGTAVWLSGKVDPTVVDGARHLDVGALAPELAFGPRDQQAIEALAAELEATRPLLDVFDGELQVLRRLELAADAVEILREQDRDLLYRARVLQGFAAWRYYGESLQDAGAAAWRYGGDGSGGPVANRPWVDAVALDPDRAPSPELLPDEQARRAYQSVRAWLLMQPDASVELASPADGAWIVLDGRPQRTERVRVLPGEHRLHVESPAGVHLRSKQRLASGQAVRLTIPATATELASLASSLPAKGAMALPAPALERLGNLPGPVTLLVQDGRALRRYELRAGAAHALSDAVGPAARGIWTLRSSLSAAWMNDGEWYLQHAAEGAEHDMGTVNGVLPGLHLGGAARLGPMSLGLGVDGRMGVGENQVLYVGDANQRLRLHPHLAVGLPWVQATVGAALPWRLGLGGRLQIPLMGPMEWTGGFLWEKGLTYNLPDGRTFSPTDALSAWTGMGMRWSPPSR